MNLYQLQLNLPPNYTKAQKDSRQAVVEFLTRNSEQSLTVFKLCKVKNIS